MEDDPMETQPAETTKTSRRHFPSAEKVRIIKQHLVDKAPLSELCAREGLQPSQFYQWQQEFFARSRDVFERTDEAPTRRLTDKISALEAKLGRRDEALAELLEEHVALKKKLGVV
jgi:transposase-like protein